MKTATVVLRVGWKIVDPAKIVSKKTYDDALRMVNVMRKAAGKSPLNRLPNGDCSLHECPIGRALSGMGRVSVSRDGILFSSEKKLKGVTKLRRLRWYSKQPDWCNMYLPKEFRQFLKEFDRGVL